MYKIESGQQGINYESMHKIRLINCKVVWSENTSTTPALATSQPQCEFPETILTSSHIIHTADEEFICPGKYRWRIFAQLQIFQGKSIKMTFLGLKTIYIFIIHTKE